MRLSTWPLSVRKVATVASRRSVALCIDISTKFLNSGNPNIKNLYVAWPVLLFYGRYFHRNQLSHLTKHLRKTSRTNGVRICSGLCPGRYQRNPGTTTGRNPPPGKWPASQTRREIPTFPNRFLYLKKQPLPPNAQLNEEPLWISLN